jgi:predicted anti-sigma-YlaC factor YlaD
MNDQNDCQFASKVLESVRSGVWTSDLKNHLATCARCREVVNVASALQVMADETPIPTSLPNHRLIWLKAQVLKNQKRVARLELLGKLGAAAAVVVAAAVIAIWNWLGSSTDLTAAPSLTDWRHTLKMAAPLIIALVVIFGANNLRPRTRRDRWL